MRAGGVLCSAFLAFAGCGVAGTAASGAAQTIATSAGTPFAYDRSIPLRYVDRGVINKGYPIRIHDVSYTSNGTRIDGLLAVPPGKGPFPAVLYLHGSGGDRRDLIVPATWMATRGVVALTISVPVPGIPQGLTPAQQLEADRRAGVAAVVATRRAVDVLQSLPQVKRDRLGLVGFSAGAKLGAIMSGVEPRVRAFDLLSAGAPPVSAYVAQAPPSLKATMRRELSTMDPLRWVARARPGTVLLQNGRKDEIVPRAALQNVVRAAGADEEVRWYAAQGHAPGKKAWLDQLRWTAAKLGVDGPVVKGAASGP
jgi:dienelactone hydrolase